MSDNNQVILNFIRKHTMCVISTVDSLNLKPESAVVDFGQTEELELVFDTFKTTRKYKNLLTNPKVAVVIGWDEGVTVQYEGVAVEVTGGQELDKYKQVYFNKLPEAQKWENAEGITYFKVVPKWIRYTDLNTTPWTVHELSF